MVTPSQKMFSVVLISRITWMHLHVFFIFSLFSALLSWIFFAVCYLVFPDDNVTFLIFFTTYTVLSLLICSLSGYVLCYFFLGFLKHCVSPAQNSRIQWMEQRGINTCDYDKIIKGKICILRTAFSKWRFVTWNSIWGLDFLGVSYNGILNCDLVSLKRMHEHNSETKKVA